MFFVSKTSSSHFRRRCLYSLEQWYISNQVYTKQERCNSTASSTATYYDSQSGLHVPVHHEKEISLILDVSANNNKSSFFSIPPQLYKEDPGSIVPDQLHQLHSQGIQGLIVPPFQFPRDVRNVKTLIDVAPSCATFPFIICSTGSLSSLESITDDKSDQRLHALCTLSSSSSSSDNEGGAATAVLLENQLEQFTSAGIRTVLKIEMDHLADMGGAMSVASKVATLIDQTGSCDLVWIGIHTQSDLLDDDILEVCEELMYLDVAGPTLQSRLMVDVYLSSNGENEMVDEVMLTGVNKFAIRQEEAIDLIQEVAKWQGKALIGTTPVTS